MFGGSAPSTVPTIRRAPEAAAPMSRNDSLVGQFADAVPLVSEFAAERPRCVRHVRAPASDRAADRRTALGRWAIGTKLPSPVSTSPMYELAITCGSSISSLDGLDGRPWRVKRREDALPFVQRALGEDRVELGDARCGVGPACRHVDEPDVVGEVGPVDGPAELRPVSVALQGTSAGRGDHPSCGRWR